MTLDKRYHFAAGAAIGLICLWSFWVSLWLCLAAAVGKEVKDEFGLPWLKRRWPSAPSWLVDKGTVEAMDVLATLAGWGVVAVLVLVAG